MQSCSAPSDGYQAALGLLFFKAATELESKEWEWDKLKCHKTHCSHPVQQFFLSNCSLDCSKPLINFQSFKIIDNFKTLCATSFLLWKGGVVEVLGPSSVCASLN